MDTPISSDPQMRAAAYTTKNPEKPVFVVTHPRSCSTAFERVFMTKRDALNCAHEPFGDAFYYGPERLSVRYEDDEAAREGSGFTQVTYKDVLDRLERDGSEGKRLFIKDMAYYLMRPDKEPTTLAPSVCSASSSGASTATPTDEKTFGSGAEGGSDTPAGQETLGKMENPTALPLEILKQYHFTFLIRHPRRAIPSYYRCTIPPLDKMTGFHYFMPNEAGYEELRRLFDYLRDQKLIGPHLAAPAIGHGSDKVPEEGQVNITVIDADDLLDHPLEIIQAFCRETGIDFSPDMLSWQDEEEQKHVELAFAKWTGFHEDAIASESLKPRQKKHVDVTDEADDAEWLKKYGEEGQKAIRQCVNDNVETYEYLKSFALKV